MMNLNCDTWGVAVGVEVGVEWMSVGSPLCVVGFSYNTLLHTFKYHHLRNYEKSTNNFRYGQKGLVSAIEALTEGGGELSCFGDCLLFLFGDLDSSSSPLFILCFV